MPTQTISTFRNEGGNSNFNSNFFSPAFTLLVSGLNLTLLDLFLNNLPFFLKVLWTVFVHVGINVNVFVQKNIHHILNYEQKSMENCLLWDK